MLIIPDYSIITESPGLKATKEQIARLYHRYRFALDYSVNKDVIEVACGSGIGLGYLAKIAKSVTGGDIDENNVALCRKLYDFKYRDQSPVQNGRIEVSLIDAHHLNFSEQSFGLVLLYEAIYYLKDPAKFIAEAYRILIESGVLIICTVNKDWIDFHPSPYIYKYYSVPELYRLLSEHFSEVELFGAFSTKINNPMSHIVSYIKRIATKFHLIPGSLAGRAYLKRLFLGPLKPTPRQISEGMAEYEPPVLIPSDISNKDYKIIYAVARK
ncbi:MAG: class I SAM-dependent methyltransferase [Desulfobacterales bacterium]|nr:class I SAM-dependent methyltransferase [Desulfobacterales bacterium]